MYRQVSNEGWRGSKLTTGSKCIQQMVNKLCEQHGRCRIEDAGFNGLDYHFVKLAHLTSRPYLFQTGADLAREKGETREERYGSTIFI